MTNNQLEQCLINEIETLTEGLCLNGMKGEKRRLKGYPEAIPLLSLPQGWNEAGADSLGDSDPDDALIPYFIVKTTEIAYNDNGASAKLYLLFCICDHSEQMEGYQTLWNLINRVAARFRENVVLDAYYCEREMKAVVQEEDTYPYFFGGMEMIWNLPEMEVLEV